MTVTDLLLIASAIMSGLFAGLMMTLVLVLQRMWMKQSAGAYAASMQTFLPAAKGHPVISAITILPIILPLLALASLSAIRAGLALIAAVLALLPLLLTLRLNFPIYDTIMAWQPDAMPADWQAVRHRFHRLNLARFVASILAMLFFMVALSMGA